MKQYTGNCVGSTEGSINEMCDYAQEIEYAEFIEQIEVDQLKTLFPGYDWAEGDVEGLRFRDDWAVSFWQSKFMKKPCVYVEHSRIEYIFC